MGTPLPCRKCITFAICRAQFNCLRNESFPYLPQSDKNMIAVYKMYDKCSIIRPVRSIFVEENLRYNEAVARMFIKG